MMGFPMDGMRKEGGSGVALRRALAKAPRMRA